MQERFADEVKFENARIGFLNFSGEPTKFNPQGGKRSFAIFLSNLQAKELEAQGWNVKWPRDYDYEDDARDPYLSVAVSFKGRPPRVVLISSRGRRGLPEDMVDIIDKHIDIQSVDLKIRPYDWELNGNSGRKAYLKSIYVIMHEDDLELKYAHLPEIGGAIPGLSFDEVLEGEVLEELETERMRAIEGRK